MIPFYNPSSRDMRVTLAVVPEQPLFVDDDELEDIGEFLDFVIDPKTSEEYPICASKRMRQDCMCQECMCQECMCQECMCQSVCV
jgi:hypothetical protein